MCLLLVQLIIGFFSSFLLQPFTVLMKKTRAVKQSRCLWSERLCMGVHLCLKLDYRVQGIARNKMKKVMQTRNSKSKKKKKIKIIQSFQFQISKKEFNFVSGEVAPGYSLK
jgi:hypothetical protein